MEEHKWELILHCEVLKNKAIKWHKMVEKGLFVSYRYL